MESSITLGNNLLTRYNTTKIVCPSTLKSSVFTAAALDNIDHNPSSTTAEGSFHGTEISLFQNAKMKNPGVERHRADRFIEKNYCNYQLCLPMFLPFQISKKPEILAYSTTEFSLLNNENQTDTEERLVVQIFIRVIFKRFPANVPLLYPLKT